MSAAVLFIRAKLQKQPQCPVTKEWLQVRDSIFSHKERTKVTLLRKIYAPGDYHINQINLVSKRQTPCLFSIVVSLFVGRENHMCTCDLEVEIPCHTCDFLCPRDQREGRWNGVEEIDVWQG